MKDQEAGIMTALAGELEQALRILESGGILLYPTDTVWGIGCDAFHEGAVSRIRHLKQVPPEESFVLLVESMDMLRRYVRQVHPRVETLLAYHQRPLTVVYQEVMQLPEYILSTRGDVAIRITRDPFCRELIRRLGRPIVSTTAHRSSTPCPTFFGEISSEVIRYVDKVVRYRQEEREPGTLSVIITFDQEGELIFLRE